MNGIVIIGEGPTEQGFCNDVLRPFFQQQGVYIESPTIKQSKGGIVPWRFIEKQILLTLKNPDVAVTLLIDYYGIEPKHNFPKWEESLQIEDKSSRMAFLETAMKEALNLDYKDQPRFIPYIQLHEFEGLLFSDISVIQNNFERNEFKNLAYLNDTVKEFPNSEDINNGIHTAPSKRLKDIIDNYDKIVYGSLLAQETRLDKTREKCPRFNNWIDSLLKINNL